MPLQEPLPGEQERSHIQRIFVERSPFHHRSYAVHVLMGDYSIAQRIESIPYVENRYTVTAPLFSIGETEAQALMDNLWNCGLRPSEGSGSAGSLAATQRHLDDMRRLVWHQLKIEGFPKP